MCCSAQTIIIINLILAYWNEGVGALYMDPRPATGSVKQVFSLLSALLFQNPKEYL